MAVRERRGSGAWQGEAGRTWEKSSHGKTGEAGSTRQTVRHGEAGRETGLVRHGGKKTG